MFSETGTVQKPCDVCKLLDQDATPKQVEWCSACQAWICPTCRNDWKRRALAAAKTHLGYGRAI